jgi:hypothetical protein
MSRPGWLALAVLLAACDSGERVVPKGAPRARDAGAAVPVDRLAPGELAPGRADAFGLLLPKELRIEARFADAVHASGPVQPEPLVAFVRKRVEVSHVEIAAGRTIFPRATIRDGTPGRSYRIEVIPDGPRTKLVVRDVTPPPTVEGISEEERWRRAGLRPDGQLIDPRVVE